MEPHYERQYFFAEKYGFKKFKRPDGSTGEFGYTHGGMWSFDKILHKLIELLGVPQSVLDIGAGCGGWVATLNNYGIEALGLEFSQYAIDNAILGAQKYLKKWDVEQTPWPVERKYDWVTAIDLFEHLFADKVDSVIAECKRVAKKWIVAKICSAQKPEEVYAAKRMATYEETYAQAVKDGFEWLIVSGHVNSQLPQYWREKFQDGKWRLRDDLAEKLKKDLALPDDWRCTIIAENTRWFQEEFG